MALNRILLPTPHLRRADGWCSGRRGAPGHDADVDRNCPLRPCGI